MVLSQQRKLSLLQLAISPKKKKRWTQKIKNPIQAKKTIMEKIPNRQKLKKLCEILKKRHG